MEKVYRLLDWLTFENALDWLRTLTETPIGGGELWRLVMSKQCDSYIQALGLHGHYINDDGHEIEVIGRGFQLVVGSETIRKADKKNGIPEKRRLSLEGARYEPDPCNKEIAIVAGYDYWEAVTAEVDGYPLYFKPTDIEALAAKMNGVKEQPSTAEVEDIRQQLEQERTAREAAETELLKRRAEDGKRTLDNMRIMLMHDHKEFSAMQVRAENAERMVAALERQLSEQSEQQQLNGKAFKEMGRQLSECVKGRKSAFHPEAPATGLTFPYATKHLEAMRDAALEHWSGHDRSKPAPYGIQKAVQTFLATRTGENARKLAELAAAIKPDDLPKS